MTDIHRPDSHFSLDAMSERLATLEGAVGTFRIRLNDAEAQNADTYNNLENFKLSQRDQEKQGSRIAAERHARHAELLADLQMRTDDFKEWANEIADTHNAYVDAMAERWTSARYITIAGAPAIAYLIGRSR